MTSSKYNNIQISLWGIVIDTNRSLTAAPVVFNGKKPIWYHTIWSFYPQIDGVVKFLEKKKHLWGFSYDCSQHLPSLYVLFDYLKIIKCTLWKRYTFGNFNEKSFTVLNIYLIGYINFWQSQKIWHAFSENKREMYANLNAPKTVCKGKT